MPRFFASSTPPAENGAGQRDGSPEPGPGVCAPHEPRNKAGWLSVGSFLSLQFLRDEFRRRASLPPSGGSLPGQ